MDILDLRGPDFLKLYAVLLGAAIAVGLVLRGLLRGSGGTRWREVRLEAGEIAYVTGGRRLVINSALAALYRAKRIKVSAGGKALSAEQPPADGEATPVEQQVYHLIATGRASNVRQVHRATRSVDEERVPTEAGLTLTVGGKVQAALVSAMPVLLVLATGIAKIGVGLSRNKNVAFLMISCVVTTLIMIGFLCAPPRRTRAGDALLRGLKSSNAGLRSTAVSNPGTLAAAEFALAMGLFGPAVLAGPEMGDLRQAIVPPTAGSGCGAGCGGGGGGDGGGGGGCGGCGGGGCGG